MAFWPAAADYTHILMAALLAGPSVFVTIINPAEAATVTTQLIDIQWAFSPGVQTSYRIKIFDTAGTILIHDTGVVATSSKLATLDAALVGLENTVSYKIQVFVNLANGTTGQSDLRSFTLNAATGNDVTGLSCTENVTGLPKVELAWTAFTLTGGETFLNYNVWRRKSGTTSWTRIAGPALTNRTGDVSFDDYGPDANIAYEYTVTARVAVTTGEDESDKQGTPEECTLIFGKWYLHDVNDVTTFLEFTGTSATVTQQQAQREIEVWGRQAPTLHIGDRDSFRIALSGITGWDYNRAMWDTIVLLMQRQRTTGAILEVRFRDQRYFCQLVDDGRRDFRGQQYESSIILQEVHFDESV